MMASLLVRLYGWWHGTLGLRGAGLMLRRLAPSIRGLQRYPLEIPKVGTVTVDFRDCSAWFWVNKLLGDAHQDEGLIIFLRRHFGANGIFWDVGANIGVITASIFQSFPTATYCAFEPNPQLGTSLKDLFQSHPNVIVYSEALSDENGVAFLKIPTGSSAIARLGTDNSEETGTRVVKITGDSFMASNPRLRPTLIKIDVEGHEPAVVKGMKHLITTCRPIVAFEHLFLTPEEIRALFPESYKLYFVDDLTGELSQTLDPARSRNSVLIPDERC